MYFKRLMASAALATGVGFAAGAHADVLYDNLGAVSDGADPAGFIYGLFDSFSTGGTATTGEKATLLLSGDPFSGGFFAVGLFSDNAGAPGTLQDINFDVDADLSIMPTPLTYGFHDPLAANTRYWIGLGGLTSAFWSWSLDTSGTGVANEFFANPTGISPNVDGPYQMQVTSGAVPEPATWAMVLVGLGAAGGMLRRARRAGAAATA